MDAALLAHLVFNGMYQAEVQEVEPIQGLDYSRVNSFIKLTCHNVPTNKFHGLLGANRLKKSKLILAAIHARDI